jgi:hypothetical protein
MFKFLVSAIVIALNSVNLFAADALDPSSPDNKLKTLPVYVRYDAKQFYDGTYNLFMRQDNPYIFLFKGIIIGKTFGVLDDTDTLLEVAVNSLVSTEELENSKRFLSTVTGCDQSTRIDTASLISDRNKWRADFTAGQFGTALNNLYKKGNIYAVFVKGFLGYDEATDSLSSNKTGQHVAELELAAHHLCLPALKFCEWLYDDRGENSSNYKIKRESITQGVLNYNLSYFDPLLYLEEIIKNPFQQNSSFLSMLTLKVTPTGLPVIDVLDKVKKSINLLNSVLTRNNLPDEVSYYGRVFSKLTEFSGSTRILKPALGNWGKVAVVGSPFVGIVSGAIGLHKGQTTAIFTTVAAVTTALYGATGIVNSSCI